MGQRAHLGTIRGDHSKHVGRKESLISNPFAEECRLAETGRSGDKRQLSMEPSVQLFDQVRAGHALRVWTGGRNVELGFQERSALPVGWRIHCVLNEQEPNAQWDRPCQALLDAFLVRAKRRVEL